MTDNPSNSVSTKNSNQLKKKERRPGDKEGALKSLDSEQGASGSRNRKRRPSRSGASTNNSPQKVKVPQPLKGEAVHKAVKGVTSKQSDRREPKPLSSIAGKNFTPFKLPQETSDDVISFAPLGGVGEIGLNMYLYGAQGKWILVDCGIGFSQPAETPGVFIQTPDPVVLEGLQAGLEAIVITHAHDDHIGALPHVWTHFKKPIYATPFAAAMIREKFSQKKLNPEIIEIKPGDNIKFSMLDVTLFQVSHSILEPCSLLIRRPSVGTVVHTGDWKVDPDPLLGLNTDFDKLKSVIKDYQHKVVAMVCDSTNALNDHPSGSEGEVFESLKKTFSLINEGRIIFSTFASNGVRLYSAIMAAKAVGRQVYLCGRSMERVVECAKKAGYFQDLPPLLNDSAMRQIAPHKLLILATGSQGEEQAALARMVAGTHPKVKIQPKDTFIFAAKTIPGNDRSVNKVKNEITRKGGALIDSSTHLVHVSGHATRPEIAQYIEAVKPPLFVPMHGEALHLEANRELALALGVPRSAIAWNGDQLNIHKDSSYDLLKEKWPVEAWGVDQHRLIPLNSSIIKDRQRLMDEGIAFYTVMFSPKRQHWRGAALHSRGIFLESNLKSEHKHIVSKIDRHLRYEASTNAPLTAERIEAIAQREFSFMMKRLSGKRTELAVQVITLS